MAAGTIVAAWEDTVNAHVAIRVAEGGAIGTVEYIVSTPLVDASGNVLTVPQLKTNLLAAISALRAQQLFTPTAVGAITGAVVV